MMDNFKVYYYKIDNENIKSEGIVFADNFIEAFNKIQNKDLDSIIYYREAKLYDFTIPMIVSMNEITGFLLHKCYLDNNNNMDFIRLQDDINNVIDHDSAYGNYESFMLMNKETIDNIKKDKFVELNKGIGEDNTYRYRMICGIKTLEKNDLEYGDVIIL